MKKILVVDDLSVNIASLQAILNTYMPDYEILTALSGAKAILIAQEEKPEAILLDYLMPHMNGFETCRRLKEDEKTSNIPVLIVSALGDSSKIRTEGLNAGADAFISKPYDIRELVALVNVMLRIKHAEDSLKKRNEYLELFIKKQTRRYEDSEERFLQISKHALEFFWELNNKGVFIFISESVESILGYKSKDILDQFTLFDFADESNGYKSKQKIEEKIRLQQSFDDDEYAFKHQTGRRVWLTINGFPIFDNENNFQGYRGVCDDNTRRKEAEDQVIKSMTEIKNYQQKLKNLNKELTLTEEKERKRIAEYLHDGIGQTLSLAYLKLSSVLNLYIPAEAEEIISKASSLINTAIAESRLLTYDLSPPVLHEFGLIAAIKWKLDQTSKKYDISVKFNDNGISTNFETDTNLIIYRIICELIANVIKHAQASTISVEIVKNKKDYFFSVADNGIGIEPNSIEEPQSVASFGLFSISERLDSMNGSLVLESEPGTGTIAKVFIPG